MLPEAIEHLPLIEQPQGWLMDQVVTFIEAPPPSVSFVGIWGGSIRGYNRLEIQEGEDGVVTGRIRTAIPAEMEQHYRAGLMKVPELVGRRTGPRAFLLFGVGTNIHGRENTVKWRIRGFLHVTEEGQEQLQLDSRYGSLDFSEDLPLRSWRGHRSSSFTRRASYDDTKPTKEDMGR